MDIDRMKRRLDKASDAGYRAGRKDTRIGARFRGAWAAARDLGYYDDLKERRAFTSAYLISVPYVDVDETGRVTASL